MIKKSKLAILLIFMTSLLIIGYCFISKKDINSENTVVQEKHKKIVLGFSQIGDESAWRTANTLSVMSAAKEAGIDILFSNAQQKQQNQIKAIRSFIDQQVDIIAFSPIVETGWDEVLQEAKISGIPVIILDRSIKVKDEDLYTTYIGTDFLEEGRMAGKWLVEKCKNSNKPIGVVELNGTTSSAPTIQRSNGFREIIQSDSNIRIIESENGDFMRSKGKEIMEGLLESQHGKIDVVYAHNDDMALGAIEAIEEYGLKPGNDIIIVSIDAVRSAFEAMIVGKLNCSVECNPLQGPQLMKTVLDLVNGQSVRRRIVIEERVFTQETAANELPNRKY
jgi:simple sugar transport system substrate-binding protein